MKSSMLGIKNKGRNRRHKCSHKDRPNEMDMEESVPSEPSGKIEQNPSRIPETEIYRLYTG